MQFGKHRVKLRHQVSTIACQLYPQQRRESGLGNSAGVGQDRSFARPRYDEIDSAGVSPPTPLTSIRRLTITEVPVAKMRVGSAGFLGDSADTCQSPYSTPDAELLWYQRAAPPWNGRIRLRVKFEGTVSAAAWWICIISSLFAKTASAMA